MVTVCIGFARMYINLLMELSKTQIHPQSGGASKSLLCCLFLDQIVRAMRMQEYDGLRRRGINDLCQKDVNFWTTTPSRYKLIFDITTLIKPNNSFLKGDDDMTCMSKSLSNMLSHCKAVSYAKKWCWVLGLTHRGSLPCVEMNHLRQQGIYMLWSYAHIHGVFLIFDQYSWNIPSVFSIWFPIPHNF